MMNWETVSTVAQLIAAITVPVTLIYLAVQVRQTRADLHATACQEVEGLFSDTSNSLATSPELARAIALASSSKGDQIEDWQSVMIDAHLTSNLNAWELTLELVDSGVMSYEREALLEVFSDYMAQPWASSSWERIRSSWLPAFQELIDSQLAAHRAATEHNEEPADPT